MKKSRILFICLLFATGLYAEDQVLQLTRNFVVSLF